MPNTATAEGLNSTRDQMINLLNEDLAKGYQTVIAYTKFSQVLKSAAHADLARELEQHASEELLNAIKLAKQIDYLRAIPGEFTPAHPPTKPTGPKEVPARVEEITNAAHQETRRQSLPWGRRSGASAAETHAELLASELL